MGRVLAGLAVVAVAAVVAWNFYFKPRRDAVVERPPIVEPVPLVEPSIEAQAERDPDQGTEPPPAFVTASPEPAGDEEPPALDDSDAAILDALRQRFAANIARVLVSDSVVRKFVVTVDNLPGEVVSMKVRAIRAAPERFRVAGQDDDITLDPDNYARYASFMKLVSATDPSDAVDAYVHFYPLLQKAFEELGYPERQFHARLVEVIDHLLETPEVNGPIRLTRPHVLYEFEDPDLQSLSAGQKVLLRIGHRNAIAAKDWLHGFKAELESRLVD